MLNNWSNNKRRMHRYPMKRKLCNSKEKYKPIITELEKNIIIVIPTSLKPIKMIFVGDKDANL